MAEYENLRHALAHLGDLATDPDYSEYMLRVKLLSLVSAEQTSELEKLFKQAEEEGLFVDISGPWTEEIAVEQGVDLDDTPEGTYTATVRREIKLPPARPPFAFHGTAATPTEALSAALTATRVDAKESEG